MKNKQKSKLLLLSYRDQGRHRRGHLVDSLVVPDVPAVGRHDGDPLCGVVRGAAAEAICFFFRGREGERN